MFLEAHSRTCVAGAWVAETLIQRRPGQLQSHIALGTNQQVDSWLKHINVQPLTHHGQQGKRNPTRCRTLWPHPGQIHGFGFKTLMEHEKTALS